MNGSKDIKALELSYLLERKDKTLEDCMTNVDEVKLLCQTILKKG
jgi:hypothetical protein